MKNLRTYILLIGLFVAGIVLGVNFFGTHNASNEKNYLAVDKPVKYGQKSYNYQLFSMLGRQVVLNGRIEEAYKNKNNELVIYMQVENLPLKVSCTLKNTDMQIKSPVKLGEIISVQGNFTGIDERMKLTECTVLRREND